ncbi:MAG: preprotein translocase subunit SecE [Bacillota bacterium]|jgi:preprotein translocase subunit SecE|nr:preprotein translocase subunit SecE [Bacillota bacterium]MDI9414917.1 preprotein translocase subunit SecE [Bacillota bacterium]HAV20547.1 preprotein translocase subunit SecE [Bacillota bacterium]HOJ57107.1 preprotein translocase subunit SecE [Bacillota bacterium]HOL01287.1 preprotein translocase subunit SecE [Bacillota bacterium]
MRIAEWFGRMGKFFREVRAELRKVTWPGRKELVTSALVVIFVVIISTTYIGLIDYAFSRVLQVLIR